jgi:hypothetical protein
MSQWGDPPETAFQILDGDSWTCHWPPLLRRLYERARPEAAPLQSVHLPVSGPLACFGTDRLAHLVVGAAPERPRPSFLDYDALAAEVIRDGLREQRVGLDLVRADDPVPVPAPVDHDLVVIGGPGSHRLGEVLNEALARRAWGIRGFYFAPAGEASDRLGNLVRCWRLRAHDLPEEPGIPDPDDPYVRLPDGRKEDMGILYMGANLLARQYGLVWVAGLGSVGTVGAALALQDGRVVEAITRGTDEEMYACALVRYRFADEQRPLDGTLACVALTRGVLRSSLEDPAAAALRP